MPSGTCLLSTRQTREPWASAVENGLWQLSSGDEACSFLWAYGGASVAGSCACVCEYMCTHVCTCLSMSLYERDGFTPEPPTPASRRSLCPAPFTCRCPLPGCGDSGSVTHLTFTYTPVSLRRHRNWFQNCSPRPLPSTNSPASILAVPEVLLALTVPSKAPQPTWLLRRRHPVTAHTSPQSCVLHRRARSRSRVRSGLLTGAGAVLSFQA